MSHQAHTVDAAQLDEAEERGASVQVIEDSRIYREAPDIIIKFTRLAVALAQTHTSDQLDPFPGSVDLKAHSNRARHPDISIDCAANLWHSQDLACRVLDLKIEGNLSTALEKSISSPLASSVLTIQHSTLAPSFSGICSRQLEPMNVN
ncbi:unnamed protein product [Phytophthora fragariaefolia]|uniref:Unnamed protein product n=1 Tax=Phytophthora fragariaefolia TaxID=1490495 RepID=A0A9W6Y6Q5_9STRA|nr:unnamed protein product [Phytophthora fragariaefolia]